MSLLSEIRIELTRCTIISELRALTIQKLQHPSYQIAKLYLKSFVLLTQLFWITVPSLSQITI